MLSTEPYKGVRDFYPEDLNLRNYIFSIWRKTCESFGFKEYDGPFLEPFELYAGKSGEELVNEQLYSFTDKGERKVAIRPEMTPTVSRMAAKKLQQGYPTPIKWFSIANFYRYEKPQKGRGREFYQLNVDIFGEESVLADLEILTLNQKLMETFKAEPNMYRVKVSNRYLVNFLLENIIGLNPDQKKPVIKAIDKRAKISEKDFVSILENSKLSKNQISKTIEVLSYTIEDIKKLKNLPENASQLTQLFDLIEKTNLKSVVFDLSIVRGLDYYDGNVFEQFDLAEGNLRSMFGGGRYDGLISLFINKKIPAVGFAPGDITLSDFLTSWNLIPDLGAETDVLVTVFPSNEACFLKSQETANILRSQTGLKIETYSNPSTDLTKQIKYADRKKIRSVIIIGPDELEKNCITLKNLESKEQKTFSDISALTTSL